MGKTVRAIRMERKLTQEGLAQAADLNLSYVSAIERGDNNPTLLTLIALAKALNVTLLQLLEDTGL
ncbi:helix-turn-helix domain-containing protein [Duganella sp. FT135W]|uniref:Helix-turn-helix domain-containing protein n=1 Tax=Duganella flavida TaxID=2692175 RepID=A0A6L8K8G5_9BURK|nr:helix-turn-helix domain-containing protein [Duganella flavida]